MWQQSDGRQKGLTREADLGWRRAIRRVQQVEEGGKPLEIQGVRNKSMTGLKEKYKKWKSSGLRSK